MHTHKHKVYAWCSVVTSSVWHPNHEDGMCFLQSKETWQPSLLWSVRQEEHYAGTLQEPELGVCKGQWAVVSEQRMGHLCSPEEPVGDATGVVLF